MAEWRGHNWRKVCEDSLRSLQGSVEAADTHDVVGLVAVPTGHQSVEVAGCAQGPTSGLGPERRSKGDGRKESVINCHTY